MAACRSIFFIVTLSGVETKTNSVFISVISLRSLKADGLFKHCF